MTFKQFSYNDRLRIKREYELFEEVLLRHGSIDPYSIWPHDWTAYMSPIEKNVWNDMRCHGLKMYPQYPIGKYFVDFCDPINLIVIEVDGKEYHSSEKQILADCERQRWIENKGYKVYRIEGKNTFSD